LQYPNFGLHFIFVYTGCFYLMYYRNVFKNKLMFKTSHGQPAARGPHVALEALQCGPSTDSKKRYFGRKPIGSLEKIQILALKRAIFQKCGPRTDLGWPWLFKTQAKNHEKVELL
jgi:hypothetical protein